jgi:hypothetical protein
MTISRSESVFSKDCERDRQWKRRVVSALGFTLTFTRAIRTGLFALGCENGY